MSHIEETATYNIHDRIRTPKTLIRWDQMRTRSPWPKWPNVHECNWLNLLLPHIDTFKHIKSTMFESEYKFSTSPKLMGIGKKWSSPKSRKTVQLKSVSLVYPWSTSSELQQHFASAKLAWYASNTFKLWLLVVNEWNVESAVGLKLSSLSNLDQWSSAQSETTTCFRSLITGSE